MADQPDNRDVCHIILSLLNEEAVEEALDTLLDIYEFYRPYVPAISDIVVPAPVSVKVGPVQIRPEFPVDEDY